MKQIDRFRLRISLLPAKRLRAFDELHIHRHFHFQYIDAVAVFAELTHAFGNDLRFLLCVFQSLLIRALLIPDKFQEVRNIIRAALIPNALHPGMLFIVNIFGIERRVVKQNLDAVRARFF